MATESNAVEAQIPISPDLPGRERIRVMLLARGYELKQWAESQEPPILPSQLSMMLSGARPYPDIRDKLAAFLGMSRQQLDAILPLPEAA